MLVLVLASILDEHDCLNRDVNINVGTDIIMQNIVRIANFGTCTKVLVLVYICINKFFF